MEHPLCIEIHTRPDVARSRFLDNLLADELLCVQPRFSVDLRRLRPALRLGQPLKDQEGWKVTACFLNSQSRLAMTYCRAHCEKTPVSRSDSCARGPHPQSIVSELKELDQLLETILRSLPQLRGSRGAKRLDLASYLFFHTLGLQLTSGSSATIWRMR